MIKSKHIRRLAMLAYLMVGAFLFARPLLHLATYALHSDVNSHVLLVPFVCLYLIYLRKHVLPYPSRDGCVLGIVCLLIALCLWAAAVAPLRTFGSNLASQDQLALFSLSFVLFVWGGGFLFLGRHWMWSAAFPMFFLLFMTPLPVGAVDLLENASKLASAEAASMFYDISGTPVLRDGNIFQLPGITIEVAQECSGIRSSYVLVLTSLIAGNLFLTRNWSRIVLVCFVVPLGIIRNGFRVWVISTLCIHFGPQMIHSVIHRRGGPLFFTLSLIPLLGFAWFLRWLEQRKYVAKLEPPIQEQPVRKLGEIARSPH